MRDARTIHDFEQLQAGIADMAVTVAKYRQALIDGGIEKHEAWAAAQRVEERMANLLFARLEAKRMSEEERAIERAITILEEAMKRQDLISDDEHE